jgi:hypothetical protein
MKYGHLKEFSSFARRGEERNFIDEIDFEEFL